VSRTISFAAILFVSLLVCLPAFSQVEGPRSEASAQFVGTFVKGTTSDGVRQTASDSGGLLATYRFFFTEHHGVEGNYGYSRSTQSYDFGRGRSGPSANLHEVSGAYVFRYRMKQITPFVSAGFAGLIYQPRDFAGASRQARPAFVYGGGADFNATHYLFIRAQYRGFVYNSPTMDVIADSAKRVTHLAEPSVGLGVRF